MKLALLVTGAALVGSMAFAADVEDAGKTTVDHSKNPITGTKTTKKQSKQKMKDAAGNETSSKVTETTKVHKDGQVEKSVEVKADSSEGK
jgi:hypothetical protein